MSSRWAGPAVPADVNPVATRLTELLRPPPLPGDLLAAVQLEWDALETIGGPIPPDLPRPWEPATCQSPALQAELATWLADHVEWLNQQHAWDPDDHIPPCWPQHPHLIHDIAVLADQRRRAAHEPTSTPLEHWQRILLPAFHDRRRHTIRQHCTAGHQRLSWTSPAERPQAGSSSGVTP